MAHDSPKHTAALISQLLEEREREKNERETEESVEIIKSVSESHSHTDSVSSSTRTVSRTWDPSVEYGYGVLSG